ncbi:MAG: hypothetical protein EBV03_02445 [Proteobacteria bacterium]|nr:hypothetical protein [Pseudomonadota bacterium]
MRGFLKKVFMHRATDRQQLAKDWAFVLNAFGISLLILALIVTFAPYADVNNPRIEEIRAVERSLVTVVPDKVPQMLVEKAQEYDRPVMLVLYASWCGYCAKLMPMLLDMVKAGELDAVKPVFLSMDSQPRMFSKYLVKTQYYQYFPPVMLREVLYNNLPAALAATGSSFEGAIPYIGFFDKRGKMIAERAGMMDKQTLLGVARTAMAAAKP